MQLPMYREYHIPHVQGVPVGGRHLPVISMRSEEKRTLIRQIAAYIEAAGRDVPVEHRWSLSLSDGRSLLLDLWWDDRKDDLRLSLAFDPQLNGVSAILGLLREAEVALFTTDPVSDGEALAERVGVAVGGLAEGMPASHG